jgi:hypothetical protein
MKISQLIVEHNNQLDEGPMWDKVKQGAKAVGNAAPGIMRSVGDVAGATAGAVAAPIGGFVGGLRRGYDVATGKANSTYGGPNKGAAQPGAQDAQAAAPAGQVAQPGTAAPAGQVAQPGTAAPAGQVAQPGTAAPAGQVAQTAQQEKAAKVGVGQINKIIPTLRSRDLQSIKKNLDTVISKKVKSEKQTGAAAPAGNTTNVNVQGGNATGGSVAAPGQTAAPATTPAAQTAAPAGPQPNQIVKLASGENYKWLGQQWVQVDPASGQQVGSFVEPNIQKSLSKLAVKQTAAPTQTAAAPSTQTAAPTGAAPNLKVVKGGKKKAAPAVAPAAAVAESRDFRIKYLEMLI